MKLIFFFALFSAFLPLSAAVHRVTCLNNAGDAALIQSAINGSLPGDTIVIDGPATIGQTIKLLGNRIYQGESRDGTVLKQADSANLVAVLASASYLDNATAPGETITIKGLTIDGNRDNNLSSTTPGIVIRNNNVFVNDVGIRKMSGDGIRISSPSANGTNLSSNQSYGVIQNCFIDGLNGIGIRNLDSNNKSIGWMLIDNWIANCGQNSSAIHVDNGNNWTIDRNHLYMIGRHGIYVDRAYNASISDNYIENFGRHTAADTYSGLRVYNNEGSATSIEGNRIFNFHGGNRSTHTYLYLRVDGVRSGTATVAVYGNLIGGASATVPSTGLSYDRGAGAALTVNHKGNTVSNVMTPRWTASGVTLVPQISGY